MSDRSEKIVVYVTESTKNAVKHEAETEDKSMAEWSRNQIHRGLKNKQEDRLLHETNAEQRINQLISEMDDRLATRLQNYQDLMGIAANYSCANHILFQKFDGIGSKLADDARSDASEIIKRSTGYQQQQPQQSNARESRAQSEQQQQQQQQQQQSRNDTLPGQKPAEKQQQADDGPTSFDEIE